MKISEPSSPWRYIVCFLLNNRYQHSRWPWLWACLTKNTYRLIEHIFTSSSAEDAVKNGGNGMFVRTPIGQTATEMLQAEKAQIPKLKVRETSALQTAVVANIEIKPRKTAMSSSDSKAALIWPADPPTVERPTDSPTTVYPRPLWDAKQWKTIYHLTKSESKQLQPLSTSINQEARTLLHNSQRPQQEGLLKITIPLQTQSTAWRDISSPQYTVCKQDTVTCKPTWSENWHHGLCTLCLHRSRTDGPPHPLGLFLLAATQTLVMTAGWINHQQAVGHSGIPAPYQSVPGRVDWGSTIISDRPQKMHLYVHFLQKFVFFAVVVFVLVLVVCVFFLFVF